MGGGDFAHKSWLFTAADQLWSEQSKIGQKSTSGALGFMFHNVRVYLWKLPQYGQYGHVIHASNRR